MRAWLLHPAAKPVAFALCLLPLIGLLGAAAFNRLGANPAEALIRSSGDWTLRLLCLTLAVTPLRVLTRTPPLARYRRMVGLFAFFHACLHLLAYGWLDMGLDAAGIGRDILKRPFILAGFCTWLLLLPLALTSGNRAARALGARRWRALHRLVYPIAALALLHFFWMRAGKRDFAEVAIYATLVTGLLGWRAYRWIKPRNGS
jgi:sulfoxide reductase heme-binding subunit YedZ